MMVENEMWDFITVRMVPMRTACNMQPAWMNVSAAGGVLMRRAS